MILISRDSLEKRDISGAIPIVWILPPLILFALVILFWVIRIWRDSAHKQATTSLANEQPRTGIKGFFRRLTPHSYHNVDLSSTRQHSSVATARASAEMFNHELQNEERNTNRMSNNRLSVRSIMTLPPYHVSPLPSERLIAREGEREGVDTVIEYPETDAGAEERREEEMQALYNIREARRRENEERAARRAERRAAVARRDYRRVHEMDTEDRLRRSARSASTSITPPAVGTEQDSSSINLETGRNDLQPDSALLIAQLHSLRDHNSQNRRVSSVSYADLGVARHDGTRLRADSTESDRRPLLDSAASIGSRDERSRASSIASGRSASRSRATLQVSQGTRPSTTGSLSSQRDGTLTPQSVTGDLPPEPPSYEDDLSVHGGEAPPYEPPVTTPDSESNTAIHVDTHSSESSPPPILVVHPVEETQPRNATPNSPPLHLDTRSIVPPPSIEVVQATPVMASSPSFPLSR